MKARTGPTYTLGKASSDDVVPDTAAGRAWSNRAQNAQTDPRRSPDVQVGQMLRPTVVDQADFAALVKKRPSEIFMERQNSGEFEKMLARQRPTEFQQLVQRSDTNARFRDNWGLDEFDLIEREGVKPYKKAAKSPLRKPTAKATVAAPEVVKQRAVAVKPHVALAEKLKASRLQAKPASMVNRPQAVKGAMAARGMGNVSPTKAVVQAAEKAPSLARATSSAFSSSSSSSSRRPPNLVGSGGGARKALAPVSGKGSDDCVERPNHTSKKANKGKPRRFIPWC